MKATKIFIYLLMAQSLFAQLNDKATSTKKEVDLLQPIIVTIGGNFIVTGSFSAFATQRLDHFITQIFTEAQSNALGNINQLFEKQKVLDELNKFPLRDITLKRYNGEVHKIDLLKYRMTGDFSFNPYLMNDDVILFPGYDPKTNFVEVDGAVNKSLKFQFVEGDKLSDALLFAGGINKAFDNINKAQISRLYDNGSKEKLIDVDLKNDFQLERGDRIKILYDETNRKEFKALVLGEVNRPGYVYLTREGLPIKHVIEKSGGLKQTASLKYSELLRNGSSTEILRKNQIIDEFQKNPQSLEWQLKLYDYKIMKDKFSFLRLSNLSIDDTIFFDIDNQLRIMNDHKYFDFTKIYDENSQESNFQIKDGDVILIPEHFNYVYVFGQVPRFGYTPFEIGKDYKYYVDKVGGKSENARDDDEIVLIKGDTKNWIVEKKENTMIEPGDFIYVPKKIPRTFSYYLERIGDVAAIVGSVATIILLIIQSGK
jgi:protein involved in polysaccharide export with SLBB domain